MAPAMDYLNQTVAITLDISAETSHVSAAVEMSRKGLVKGMYCVAYVPASAVSAVDLVATGVFSKVEFQYSTDNGSHYHNAGSGEFKVTTSGIAAQLIAFPVELDIVVEQNAPGDIQWRIRVSQSATTASADDYDVAAYLTANPGIPAANIE